MRIRKTNRKRRSETGIALLIAIFILLLISVVAIALIVSSGTESALAGNYRASTGVYYAAVAGLEEVRARLRTNNPNSFKNTAPTFLPPAGTPLTTGFVYYVLNPGPGENMGNLLTTYPDTEYDTEFGNGALAAATINTTASVWNRAPLNGLPFPGPLYKWVRINGVTEQSLNNLDTCPYDTTPDATLVYYGVVPICNPSLLNLNDQATGGQVLEITALAVLPNGGQKLLQYLVAPVPITLPPFFAALTMVTKSGNNIAYSSPNGNPGFNIQGLDQDTVGPCTPVAPPVYAVGVFSNVDQSNFINGGGGGTGILPPASRPNYKGISNPGPDVQDISATFPANLQTPAGLEAMVQTIIQSADAVISGPATGSNLPASMYSPSPNPMTIIVNGDLDLSGWNQTGYGLLLVRGNLNYDPLASWNGIVMVIGKGTVTATTSVALGEIDGAFFMATTLDASGNILSPNLGKPTMIYPINMGGEGIRYSSCWIQASRPVGSIKILSFHEISQ